MDDRLRREFVEHHGRKRLRAGLAQQTETEVVRQRKQQHHHQGHHQEGADIPALVAIHQARHQLFILGGQVTAQGHHVLREPLIIHRMGSNRSEREEMVRAALSEVKLVPVEDYLDRFPHMLSGGQRQRVATARTLILSPTLLVADEPVSMIDLSTRAEILSLMRQVQRARPAELPLYHPRHFHGDGSSQTGSPSCTLAGSWKSGTPDDIVDRPAHPYTRALISAVCEPFAGQGGDNQEAAHPR